MSGQINIHLIWHLSRSFPDKFVMYGVTIKSPIESPMISPTILNSPGSRVQDWPYRGYLYPPKTNYISSSPWPGTTSNGNPGPVTDDALDTAYPPELSQVESIDDAYPPAQYDPPVDGVDPTLDSPLGDHMPDGMEDDSVSVGIG
jgi:hypothetical protein